MVVVPCDWAKATYPIYFVDAESGETLHIVRIKKKPWANIKEPHITNGPDDYHISPDEKKLLMRAGSAALIVDLDSFEEVYEPYMQSWWFFRRPNLMRKFERLGGALSLLNRKVIEREIGFLPWGAMLGGGDGGFPDNNHVTVCTDKEVRTYDLRSGELIAAETNPYFLKSVFESALGIYEGIAPLGVSSVKLPPAPFTIAASLLSKYKAWGWLHAPSLDSEMSAYPYPGDPGRVVCGLLRVSSRDWFVLPYDFLRGEVPGWHDFDCDGWPIPMYGLGRRIAEEYRGFVEDCVGGRVVELNVMPSFSFGVDPDGRFVVLAYRVRGRYGAERDVFFSFFVVWVDLRSGRVLHVFFQDPRHPCHGAPLSIKVFRGGVTVVYLAGDQFAVFDSSFRPIYFLCDEDENIVQERFGRVSGVTGYFYEEPAVAPDLRGFVVPFFRTTWEFKEAGIFKHGLPGEFFDDSRYYALSERARREFRTLYLAFFDWDLELMSYVRIYDEEERYLRTSGSVFWL